MGWEGVSGGDLCAFARTGLVEAVERWWFWCSVGEPSGFAAVYDDDVGDLVAPIVAEAVVEQ